MKFLSDVVVVAGLSLAGQFGSTLPQSSGMSPFSVINSILNVDLNADLLDGQHGSYYLARTNHTGFQAISTITGLQTALDQWGGNIPDGSDLNTFVTSNKYGIPTHSGAATLLNAPTNRAGMLEVYKSGSFVYQTYKGLNSEKMYYRSSTSNSSISSPWSTVATEDFVTSRGYTIVTGITNGNIPRWAGTSFGDSLISQFGSSINVNGWLQIGTSADYKQMFLGQTTAGTLYFQGVSGFSDNMYWLSYDSASIGFSVGGVLNNAFLINRSNGAAAFAVSPSGPTPTTGLHLTNKTYVDGLIAGKENSFPKGDLIQGTGVTLSGILTGRLIGSGNVTINASASGSWNDALTVNATAQIMPIISRGPATSPTDYLQLKPTDYGAGKPYLAFAKSFTANKWEIYTYDGVATTGNLNFALNVTRFDVKLADENRAINTGTGLLGGGNLSADRTLTFDTSWGDSRYATTSYVGSQGFITAGSSNNLTNKTGNVSMWTNDTGYINTDSLVTALTNYVRKDVNATITADHTFTGTGLRLSPIYYHGMFSTSNTAYANYYPVGGNGGTHSYASLRVWNASGGGAPMGLNFGGDGSLTWNGGNIALQSWVTSYGFLTSGSIVGYATESWVNSRGYITNVITSLGYTPLSNDRYLSINGGPYLYFRDNIVLTGLATSSDLSNYLPVNKTITFNGITYNLNSNPNLGSSGGGGISGGGTNTYIPIFTGSSSVGNSGMYIDSIGSNILNVDYNMRITAGTLQLRYMTWSQMTSGSHVTGSIVFKADGGGGTGLGFYGYTGSSWVLLG